VLTDENWTMERKEATSRRYVTAFINLYNMPQAQAVSQRIEINGFTPSQPLEGHHAQIQEKNTNTFAAVTGWDDEVISHNLAEADIPIPEVMEVAAVLEQPSLPESEAPNFDGVQDPTTRIIKPAALSTPTLSDTMPEIDIESSLPKLAVNFYIPEKVQNEYKNILERGNVAAIGGALNKLSNSDETLTNSEIGLLFGLQSLLTVYPDLFQNSDAINLNEFRENVSQLNRKALVQNSELVQNYINERFDFDRKQEIKDVLSQVDKVFLGDGSDQAIQAAQEPVREIYKNARSIDPDTGQAVIAAFLERGVEIDDTRNDKSGGWFSNDNKILVAKLDPPDVVNDVAPDVVSEAPEQSQALDQTDPATVTTTQDPEVD